MAVSRGLASNSTQATGAFNLLELLNTFLTTQLPLPQRWVRIYDYTDLFSNIIVREMVFEAPALTGHDKVFILASAAVDPFSLSSYWQLRLSNDYDLGSPFESQPISSPAVYLPLNEDSFDYTFVANGERVIVLAQIETTNQHAYLGRYKPYGLVADFPNPVFIGGMSDYAPSFRDDSFGVSAYWDSSGGAYIYHDNIEWLKVANVEADAGVRTDLSTSPTKTSPYLELVGLLGSNPDGSATLLNVVIDSSTYGGNTYGYLDGVYALSGQNQYPGSLITINLEDYLVTNNSNRINTWSFAALRLT